MEHPDGYLPLRRTTRDLTQHSTRQQALRTLAAASPGIGVTRLGISATEAAIAQGKDEKKRVTEHGT